MKIKHHYQPTGNTCGPTCLYMIHEYLHNYPNDLPFTVPVKTTIKDIELICHTDWIVGTPPDRMIKGMEGLKIKYVEYVSSPKPYHLLKEVIKSGNIPILRTITKGVPHWIIVQDCLFEEYDVLDPWLGEIKYSEKQLDEVWKLREYQFFEVIVPKTGEINLRYNAVPTNQDFYL